MAEPTLTTTAIARPTNRAVAVLLNEAALDSPTFRSTALHFGDQIDTTEKWLGGYVSSTLKLVHDFAALDDTINSYLTKTSPLASDTLLDNDYTRLGLKRVNDGSREVLTQMLTSMKRMESTVVDPIRSFLTGDLRNFKEIRRTLEQSQRTYDSTLSRYVSQHKTKEPSALREDAFSVYESRKAYILASMDYCQLVPQIRSTLDRLLVKVSSELWKEMKGSRDAATNATRYTREMDRIKGWARGMEYAESVFTKELQAARRTLSDSTLERFKPSRELDDYSTSTVPFLSSRGPVNMKPAHQGIVISEKQGYLFLRVATSKPVKYSWVRRWHYCSDGVFGWLIPGAQGVLQGDEIGVLLCNARPAVGEERRFCFEVKTKDQTMVLQAESQTELTEWLEVFEVTKKRAFEASASRDAASLSGNDPAFSITPASAPEFSANYIDTQLHSVDEPPAGLERSGTLGIPGEGTLGVRPTYDAAGTVNRRSFSALSKDISRDESETSRDHAARIMQKLDLHRKSPDAGAGGIASLINASAAVLPAYPHPFLSPHTAKKLPSALPNIDSSRLGLLAPPTLAKPPASTNLSKTAVLLASERGPISDSRKKLPTSIVANYWGSNVWASINTPVQPVLPRLDDDDPIGVVLPEGMHASLSISSDDRKPSEVFPNNYPPELKAQHAQFRLLFPDAPPDDKLVLVFRASWSSATPQNPDDYTLAGNGRVYVTQENMYFYGQQMGLVTAYSISLDIITEVAAASRQKLIPKIQLPSHPVIFEPEDMKEMAAERHFEISAKACFHVLFGDKSFVFPKLYFEHRAKQITQGPWILVDQGKMRRDFQFKVEYADMLGRSKTANVNDYQTIDTFNDHVSYVVTHMKTAWHLPHSRSFKLMTKVVITHVAKSKCKLAIYVKIDWSKAPALSKNMVERQALRDIVSDAEELAELATDQVRKLGSRSRTSRAIQVYGHVGQQTQVVVFSPGSSDSGKKQAIKPRTLTSMIFDTVRSFGESAITSVIMWIFAAIKTIFGVITGHRLLVVLLVVSGLLNLLLGSTETSTWWKERRAAKFMRKIGVGPNAMMSKALYISDLDTAYGTDGSSVLMQRNSTCFKSFKDIFAATDMDAPWEDAGAALTLPTSRATAQRLRHTRQRLGAYRHDLVVAMRIVNSMDREMMQSEWKNWVMNENAHCDNLKAALSSSAPVKRRGVEWEAQKILNAMPADRKKAVEDWHNEYCQSCSEDFSEVVLGNKGSV
ncbi:hypothetical protein VHEMI05111 [[Torrubiella] hemipterigena]|uniref:Transcription factor SipA3 n=1 Tax=[Torrubiella] hemipterigena TaxID=1531966 RepID=A0A0A1TG97_9HYPO|nr:hypothetical protein VHEMI05111 [[Torrubiella] hemipterigena]